MAVGHVQDRPRSASGRAALRSTLLMLVVAAGLLVATAPMAAGQESEAPGGVNFGLAFQWSTGPAGMSAAFLETDGVSLNTCAGGVRPDMMGCNFVFDYSIDGVSQGGVEDPGTYGTWQGSCPGGGFLSLFDCFNQNSFGQLFSPSVSGELDGFSMKMTCLDPEASTPSLSANLYEIQPATDVGGRGQLAGAPLDSVQLDLSSCPTVESWTGKEFTADDFAMIEMPLTAEVSSGAVYGVFFSGAVPGTPPEGAPDPEPDPGAESQRLAGEDRYATSVEVSQATFDASTTDVIVARGDGRAFADALATSGVAGAVNAPVLLTHTDVAPAVVLAEIERLDPDTVHIAGGPAAVSTAAEAAIDAVTDATITRYPGENRYDTAAMLADAIGGPGDVGELATALIATGRDFPDALAGGPVAYAGGHPILLVDTNIIPAETRDALTDLGVEQVVILGGTAVVSGSVEAELEDLVGNDAIRLDGINRFATAAAVADFAVDELGFATTEVLLARSHLAADALSGAPFGGVKMAPIVLTPSDSLHPTTAAWLTANSPDVITVLGGSAAVSDGVVTAAKAAAEAGAEAEAAIAVAGTELAEAATALADVVDVATGEAAVTAAEEAVAAAAAAVAAAEASGDPAFIAAAEALRRDAAAALADAEAALDDELAEAAA